MKKSIMLTAALSAIILAGCGNETELVDGLRGEETLRLETTADETDYILGGETETSAENNSEETEPIQTEFSEEVRQMLSEVEFPEINITESSTAEEIMLAGKTAGMFYGKEAAAYFGYGGYNGWKYDFDESIEHYRCDGLYTDKENGEFTPMDYAGAKEFLKSRLNLTEKGFEELNWNSPTGYYESDGCFCLTPGDGGQAGWDYSYIIDYELGENTVTYSCERVGRSERWGYDEDMTEPFTFSLALEDGVWKLDGCSYGEGFFYRIIGSENDIEPYLAGSEDWQQNLENN